METPNDIEVIEKVKNLRKSITCPICLDYFHHPVTLSCYHSFCHACIMDAIAVRNVCPMCSVRVSKKSYLQQVIHAEEIISLTKRLIHQLDSTCTSDSIDQKHVTLSAGSEAAVADVHVGPSNPSDSDPKVESGGQTVASHHQEQKNDQNFDMNKFSIDEIVNVLPRCWPGINKPGGIAWIKAIHPDKFTYDVRYIIGGTDLNVPVEFIEKHDDLSRSSRKSKSQANESIEKLKKATDRKNDTSARKSASKRARALADCQNITHHESKSGSKRANVGDSLKQLQSLNCDSSDEFSDDLVRPTGHTDRAISIISSSLSNEEAACLEEFPSRFPNVKLSSRFNNSTTHVVVHVDEKGILNQRTMKYLQALVAGIWIVSADWLVDCLSSSTILAEKPYEVLINSKAVMQKAASRARQSMELVSR
jgi:hypothetical protein